MNTTLVTVTCLLFGLTVPLASAEGIPVGARVGPFEICYELLGDTIIKQGCVPPCLVVVTAYCAADVKDLDGDLEMLPLF